jgi:hypothetical protein
MPQTDVKTEAQHFRLYAGPREGKGIVAEVWDFATNQQVLNEAAANVEEAKTKCEEYVKGRIVPLIVWTTPHAVTFVVT